MHELRVIVVSPEEASHGVAELWTAEGLFGFTRLEEGEMMLEIAGANARVSARQLVAALERAREALAAY